MGSIIDTCCNAAEKFLAHLSMNVGSWTAFFLALAGLVSAIFAPRFIQRQLSKREKYRELRSKLSEVMYEVAEIGHWALQQQTYHDSFREKELIEKTVVLRNPADKIWAITFGYLPEYTHKSALKLVKAVLRYHAAAMQLGRVRHTYVATIAPYNERLADLFKMQDRVYEAQREFEKVTRELMDYYLKEETPDELKSVADSKKVPLCPECRV